MANTGKLIFQNLRQVYIDNNEPTGAPDKPNVSDDPDYIAPIDDPLTCPVPVTCTLLFIELIGFGTRQSDGMKYVDAEVSIDGILAPNIEWSKDGSTWYPGSILAEDYFKYRFYGFVPGKQYTVYAREFYKKQCIVQSSPFIFPVPQTAKVTFDKAGSSRTTHINALILGTGGAINSPIADKETELLPIPLQPVNFRAIPILQYQQTEGGAIITGGWPGVNSTTPAIMTVENTRTGVILTTETYQIDGQLQISVTPNDILDNYIIKVN